jgi:2-polyprenyl-6-methoxyphenol hydroxylase-like FAD-dependent oxidoreductase
MPDSGLPIKEPKVLIVGAGIAGLFMAVLLERAGIEYEIFERSAQVRPAGSAIGLGFNVMPVMEQLGLLEELKSISKPIEGTTIFKEDMEVIREIRLRDNRTLYV